MPPRIRIRGGFFIGRRVRRLLNLMSMSASEMILLIVLCLLFLAKLLYVFVVNSVDKFCLLSV